MDAPGFTRRMETFKRLTLTDFKLDIPRLASKKVLTEAWTAAGALRARGGWGRTSSGEQRRRAEANHATCVAVPVALLALAIPGLGSALAAAAGARWQQRQRVCSRCSAVGGVPVHAQP